MNTENSVVWLVTYGVQLCPDTPWEKVFVFSRLIDGPKDIKLVETLALQSYAPDAFGKEPEGEWVTVDGLRAFEYDDSRPEIEAGAIVWIEEMRIVEPADETVIKKYIASQPETWPERHCEQLRLRGVHADP